LKREEEEAGGSGFVNEALLDCVWVEDEEVDATKEVEGNEQDGGRKRGGISSGGISSGGGAPLAPESL